MKAWNLGVLLLLCGAVAACSSDSGESGSSSGSGGSGGENGGDGDGDGDGDQTTTTTGSPTSTASTATGVPATSTASTGGSPTAGSTTSTGGGCSVAEFWDGGACDACFLPACCDITEECIADAQAGGTDCIAKDGQTINAEGTIGAALIECRNTNCEAECLGDDVCDTGLATEDPELNTCINENCCEPFVECVGADGENVAACNECLGSEEGGALCDGYIECLNENCAGDNVCDTGLATEDPDLNQCINDNCCEPFIECVGVDGENVAACNECLENKEGGALCDGYVECLTENCG